MGANQFHVTAQGADAADAFGMAVRNAAAESGTSYSGTISAKDTFKVFTRPQGPASIAEIIWTIEASFKVDGARPAWVTDLLLDTYDDKWGPAVAMQDTDGTWHFFGYASS